MKENLGQVAFSSSHGLQIENLHLPHRERRKERESGILRHKNVHFGEEDKMYEGAKKEGAAVTGLVSKIADLKTRFGIASQSFIFIPHINSHYGDSSPIYPT